MSNKLFSLIHEKGSLRLSPEGKILPAAAFSEVLGAGELLKTAQQDAETYKKAVVAECEKLKELAVKEGFEAGFSQWADHLAELVQETSKAHEEVSKVVIPLALKAAKKIVGREIELSREVAVDIVATALKAVSQHKKIMVYVNKQDVEALEKARPRLKAIFERLELLSIRAREDILPGGCIIETEAGIINAQLANQWQILEKAFEALMKSSSKGETHA